MFILNSFYDVEPFHSVRFDLELFQSIPVVLEPYQLEETTMNIGIPSLFDVNGRHTVFTRNFFNFKIGLL